MMPCSFTVFVNHGYVVLSIVMPGWRSHDLHGGIANFGIPARLRVTMAS